SAALQRLALFLGQVRFEDLHDAFSSHNAWQGQRDPVRRVVRTNRDHRALVAQDYFRKARGHHTDSVLTCPSTFDDGDVGITAFLLDTLLKLRAVAILVLQGVKDRDARHARRGPYEYFRSPMLTQDVRFNRRRIDTQ